MGIIEILLVGVALSMDAFAVSVGKGLTMRQVRTRDAVIIGLYFGGFQALMPFLGWLGGSYFETYIERFDHWIAFLLLAWIGGKMLADGVKGLKAEAAETGSEAAKTEAVSSEESVKTEADTPAYKTDHKELFILAVATSIDALAVGIALAIDGTRIGLACPLIGITTFIISVAGVYLGEKVGSRYEDKATVIGGLVLICIGLKILLEHLGLIAF